jgi:tetratricopeptide (TPR) repeat protein
MHNLIAEYCQKSVCDQADVYHSRLATAWISMLPEKIQDLIIDAGRMAWSFLPEETSGERVDTLLLSTDKNIPNLSYLDCIAEAYYHSFESRGYEQSASLLFLIDRYLYRWGMIPQLFDRIVQLEQSNVQLAAQVVIRKARILKDRGEADEVLRIAETLQTPDQDMVVQAVANQLCGEANVILKDYSKAVDAYNSALEKYIDLQEAKGLSSTYGLIGDAYLEMGDLDAALENYTQAYEINRKESQTYYSSRNLWRIGEVYFAKKQYQEAIEKFSESRKLMEEQIEQQNSLDSSVDLARVRFSLSKALILNGEASRSRELLDAALKTFRQQNLDVLRIEAEEWLTRID